MKKFILFSTAIIAIIVLNFNIGVQSQELNTSELTLNEVAFAREHLCSEKQNEDPDEGIQGNMGSYTCDDCIPTKELDNLKECLQGSGSCYGTTVFEVCF